MAERSGGRRRGESEMVQGSVCSDGGRERRIRYGGCTVTTHGASEACGCFMLAENRNRIGKASRAASRGAGEIGGPLIAFCDNILSPRLLFFPFPSRAALLAN